MADTIINIDELVVHLRRLQKGEWEAEIDTSTARCRVQGAKNYVVGKCVKDFLVLSGRCL